MMRMKLIRVTATLPDDVVHRLDAAAAENETNRSTVMRQVLRQGFQSASDACFQTTERQRVAREAQSAAHRKANEAVHRRNLEYARTKR